MQIHLELRVRFLYFINYLGLNAASFDAALRYILISAMNILQGM